MVGVILTHPLFVTIVAAGVGVQLVKMGFFLYKYKKLHWLDLIATGGMPSSHSALTVGLTSGIYFMDKAAGSGPSTSFFIALALTGIVMVDAMGVRRTAGQEGVLLHRIIKHIRFKIREPHYSMGHTRNQVLVGSILGFIVAYVVQLFF